MPITPFSMPHTTGPTSEPSEDLTEKVDRRLKTTGEIMRLTAYIPDRLYELGWGDRVLELCREYVRGHAITGSSKSIEFLSKTTELPEPSKIPTEEMVKALTPQAFYWVPQALYNELKNRIVEFISEQGLD